MISSSITKVNKNRVAINFQDDNIQSIIFLTTREFMELMVKMFDYRDNNKEEIKEVLNL